MKDIGFYVENEKLENGIAENETVSGEEKLHLNRNFDWIDGVHKLREKGLNFRFLFGLYVTPRSEFNKRNILEVR